MLKALRGTKDILPEDIGIWQYVEDTARNIFTIYGYKEIRTPIIEEAPLFIRSIGDTTDIIQKEMYVFKDRGGRNIALRPEGTASIVRAYLENYPGQLEPFKKFFYIGPMFRSERPQKGRQRQFHQLGVEVIGSDSPFLDVEVISLAIKFLYKLGIPEDSFTLKINSLGCKKDKLKSIERYRKTIKPYITSLCNECNERYNKNVLRIFDCKNAKCQDVINNIEVKNSLCPDCDEHFVAVKKNLDRLNIKYEEDLKIVRGLDYYTRTVFEIIQKDLGAKDAISAGGRYDNLIKEMGGKDTPAIGFAFGIERLVSVIKEGFSEPRLDFFIVTTKEDLFKEAFRLMRSLRGANFSYKHSVSYDIDYEKKSLKGQMRKAQKRGAKFVIIFGEEEFKRKKVVFKNMDTGGQEEVDYDEKVILNKVKDIIEDIRKQKRG